MNTDFNHEDIIVSFFTKGIRNQKPTAELPILEILQNIQNGVYKSEVNSYRNLLKVLGKKDTKTIKAKEAIPYFTASGTFSPTRSNANLKEHSGLMQIDFDYDLNKDVDFEKLRLELMNDPYFLSVFTGPSGIEHGIKGLIRIPKVKSNEQQQEYANAAKEYFYTRYNGANIDPSCKDIARAFFVSIDLDLHVNPDAEIFDQKVPQILVLPPAPMDYEPGVGEHYAFSHFAQKIAAAPDGEKHRTLLRLSRWAGGLVAGGQIIESEARTALFNAIIDRGADDPNKAGKTIDDGLKHGQADPIFAEYKEKRDIFADFDKITIDSDGPGQAPPNKPSSEPSEVYSSLFESAFQKFRAESEARIAVIRKNQLDRMKLLEHTPFFPESIYKRLPKLLQTILEPYSGRVRDMLLIGVLTNIAPCLPNIRFWNNFETEIAKPLSLFSFAATGPASGKGNFERMSKIGDYIDFDRTEKFEAALKQFLEDQANAKKEKKPFTDEKPIQTFLHLTGQLTDAALIKFMSANESLSMTVTEADLITASMNGPHGTSLNANLRATSEGEAIGNTTAGEGRKRVAGGKTFGLSIASTIDQLPKMLGEEGITGNGLFSRINTYIFKQPQFQFKLNAALPPEDYSAGDAVMTYAARYIFTKQEESNGETVYLRTPAQTAQAQRMGSEMVKQVNGMFPNSHQFPVRGVQSAMRMACILSVLFDYQEDKQPEAREFIRQEAWDIAVMDMLPVLMAHKIAAVIYLLDSTNSEPAAPGQLVKSHIFDIIKGLPDWFTAKDVEKKLKTTSYKVSIRTITNYLSEWLNDEVIEPAEDNTPRKRKYRVKPDTE